MQAASNTATHRTSSLNWQSCGTDRSRWSSARTLCRQEYWGAHQTQQSRSGCGRNTTGQLHAPSLRYRPLCNACCIGISISDTSIRPSLSTRPTVNFQATKHYAAQWQTVNDLATVVTWKRNLRPVDCRLDLTLHYNAKPGVHWLRVA